MGKILEIKNLSYCDFQNINLSFDSGQLYFIVGPNNSGKTTLFYLLSSLILTNNKIKCCNELLT